MVLVALCNEIALLILQSRHLMLSGELDRHKRGSPAKPGSGSLIVWLASWLKVQPAFFSTSVTAGGEVRAADAKLGFTLLWRPRASRWGLVSHQTQPALRELQALMSRRRHSATRFTYFTYWANLFPLVYISMRKLTFRKLLSYIFIICFIHQIFDNYL